MAEKVRGRRKNEDLMRLEEVPKLLVELVGVTRSRSTIYNWARTGRANYTGNMIKLKVTHRLGGVYTTKAWVLDFIREIG